MKKIFAGLILLCVLACLGALYFRKMGTNPLVPETSDILPSPSDQVETSNLDLDKYFIKNQNENETTYQSKNYNYEFTVPKDLTVSLHGGLKDDFDTWIDIQNQDYTNYFDMSVVTFELPPGTSLSSFINQQFVMKSSDGKTYNNLKTSLKNISIGGKKGYEYEADVEGGRAEFITVQHGTRVYSFITTALKADAPSSQRVPQVFRNVVSSFKITR